MDKAVCFVLVITSFLWWGCLTLILVLLTILLPQSIQLSNIETLKGIIILILIPFPAICFYLFVQSCISCCKKDKTKVIERHSLLQVINHSNSSLWAKELSNI